MVQSHRDGTEKGWLSTALLNAVTCFDAYPMSHIDDLVERVGTAIFITTLDLCKGYWQIPLKATSKRYTAVRMPTGLYQFTVTSLGLHAAPANFQRLMDAVPTGLESFSAAYR